MNNFVPNIFTHILQSGTAGWMVEQEMRLSKAPSKKKGPQILMNRVIYNQ